MVTSARRFDRFRGAGRAVYVLPRFGRQGSTVHKGLCTGALIGGPQAPQRRGFLQFLGL